MYRQSKEMRVIYKARCFQINNNNEEQQLSCSAESKRLLHIKETYLQSMQTPHPLRELLSTCETFLFLRHVSNAKGLFSSSSHSSTSFEVQMCSQRAQSDNAHLHIYKDSCKISYQLLLLYIVLFKVSCGHKLLHCTVPVRSPDIS